MKAVAVAAIQALDADGKYTVKIVSSGSKSARQRRLQWMWYTEIAQHGIGGKYEDTKEGVHLVSKWRFAVPILNRDGEWFSDLWWAWIDKHQNDPEALAWFVEHHVSTEGFTISQMSEYLNSIYEYYADKSIHLTRPDEQGLLDM